MSNEEKTALTSGDFFEVKLESILSNYDYKILTRLYQPVIGFGPVALFMTLWSEFEGDQTFTCSKSTHERLFSVMQCTIYEFIKFRKRLEAIGLLTTKVKVNDTSGSYLYILKAPLSPRDFFKHPLLGIKFKQSVSISDFEKTKMLFGKVNRNEPGYENISSTFNEVFSIDQNASIVEGTDNLISKEFGVPRISFDFDTLITTLKENLVSPNVLTPSVRTEIASLSSVYNIPLIDMKNLIIQSVITNGNERMVDINKLRDNVTKYARNFSTVPALKTEEPVRENINAGKYSNIADLFNSLTPVQFLTVKNGGVPPIPQDVAIIDELHSKTNLTDPVINVLLDYALISLENKLILSFIMKIAGTLMRSRINTAVDAMIYFNNLGKSSQKKKSSVYDLKKEDKTVTTPTSPRQERVDDDDEDLKAFFD